MFDLKAGEIVEYSRSLLMNEGIVVRNVVWKSPKGKEVKATFKRLVSLADKNIMAIQIKITPINFEGTVKFSSYVEAGVENHTRKTNPLVDYGPFGKHLVVEELKSDEDYILYQGETKNSKLSMACGSVVVTDGHMTECVIGEEDGHTSYEVYAEEGKEVTFEKMIAYTSELDMPKEEILPFIRAKLSEAKVLGYDKYEALQKEKMDEFWSKADIKIEGDEELQQGIRFNLFHIMQSAGRDGRTGMGAKGLSGEGYEGHYFWDTEMYVLPVFVYTDSELAKQLLNYRYDTLDDARDRAKVLGHMKGALYPWRTINGKEASTYFPLGTAQYHINADIAYAFKLYLDITGDDQYLIDRAAEVLVETARVWADVGCFAECKDNKYCICSVTGPDEYNAIVDNNFYTNLMARENIRSAMWALDRMKSLDEDAYNKLVEKLELEDEELEYWERIINNMYFPFDEKLQIYPQDDGFMMRKPWDIYYTKIIIHCLSTDRRCQNRLMQFLECYFIVTSLQKKSLRETMISIRQLHFIIHHYLLVFLESLQARLDTMKKLTSISHSQQEWILMICMIISMQESMQLTWQEHGRVLYLVSQVFVLTQANLQFIQNFLNSGSHTNSVLNIMVAI